MAVKGSVAKATIEEKLKSLYTTDYIGKDGNKIYVWESDGAEKVQIAITLTCPKIQLDVPQPGLSPEGYTENGIASASGNKEITEEEKSNLEAMLEKLNL